MNLKEYLRASDGNGEAVRAVIVEERQIGDMLINVDSVLNWPHQGIATSGIVDTQTGLLDPNTVSVFYYTLNGSAIHIDQFAPGYTDVGHSQYELVLLKPTTPWADAVAEAANQPSLPAGGTAGQILTKVSSADGDADWEDAASGGGEVGDIIMSLRSTPATGRLFMSGGTYNKVDYPALWELNTVHPAYFASSDTHTFTLVDMSTRVPVGKTAARTFGVLGALMGAETHTLTTAEMPSHNHSVDPPSTTTSTTGNHNHGVASNLTRYSGGTSEQGVAAGGAKYLSATTFSAQGDHSHTVNIAAFNSASTGGGDAHNNIQPSIVINFEIIAE